MNDRFPFNITSDDLLRMSDQAVAIAWLKVQAHPAPYGDFALCSLADRIGHELIRRCLGPAYIPVSRTLADYYHAQLTRFARWDRSDWVALDVPAANAVSIVGGR
ncbi:hypothetical protein BL243_07810 [Ralstonia solanacearum]|nr:hypothetical protein BL243_07810 [Ralstonia solanacearum]